MTLAERRAAMPLCTAHMDDIREAFGINEIRRVSASENGHSFVWVNPKPYVKSADQMAGVGE